MGNPPGDPIAYVLMVVKNLSGLGYEIGEGIGSARILGFAQSLDQAPIDIQRITGELGGPRFHLWIVVFLNVLFGKTFRRIES